MFGLGFGEILLILVIALLVLGPQKLPKMANQLGKALREFRRAAGEFQSGMQQVEEFDTSVASTEAPPSSSKSILEPQPSIGPTPMQDASLLSQETSDSAVINQSIAREPKATSPSNKSNRSPASNHDASNHDASRGASVPES